MRREKEGGLMLRRLFAVLLAVSLGAPSLAGAAEKKPKQREVKIQKTSLSRDQEIELKAETDALLQALQKGDRDLKIEGTKPVTVGGKQALFTRLKTRTSYAQDPDQVVQLYTVVRSPGLWTLALAAPASVVSKAEPIFGQMIQTIKFAD
jgi:hypothetical protein